VVKGRREWTTIRVPRELKDRIDFLRRKLGKVTWEVILDSITLYESFIKRPSVRQTLPTIDKVSWYITKLATSFGAFKEVPNEENYQYVVKRVEEIKSRLGVDADLLLRVCEYYKSIKDEDLRRKVRVDLNTAFKQTVKDIITTTLFELMSKE